MQKWIEAGRFFPLSIIVVIFIWDICDTLIKYRILHLLFVLVNAGLVFYLSFRLTRKIELACWILICIPMLFQFNPRWDPITSFGPLNQLVFMLILISWIFLIKYLDSGNVIFLIISAINGFLSLCTYEVAVSLFPGVLIIVFFRTIGKSLRKKKSLIIFLLIFLLYLFITSYVILSKSTSQYSGVEIQGGVSLVIFIKQFASGFPFAFIANKVLPVIYDIKALVTLFIIYSVILLFFIFFGKYKFPVNETINISENGLLYLALTLEIVPALLVSLSTRYQQIVSYGDPYSIVYMQYWGGAILLAILINNFLKLTNTVTNKIFVICIIALTASITTGVNLGRIQMKNLDFYLPRLQLELAVKSGLLEVVDQSALVLTDSQYPWEDNSSCSAFLSLNSGKKVNCMNIDRVDVEKISQSTLQKSIYRLLRQEQDSNCSGVSLINDQFKWFFDCKEKNSHKILKEPSRRIQLILDPILQAGFYGWEPGLGKKEWAWSTGRSEINIYSLNKESSFFHVSFSVQAPMDGNLMIRGLGQTIVVKLKENVSEKVDFNTDLSPGSNKISFILDKDPITLSQSDPRLFAFKIFQMKITD